MTTTPDGPSPPPRRPGPKPRGRSVVRMTITVTPEQRAALEGLADAQRMSVSSVIRRFIALGIDVDAERARSRDSENASSLRTVEAGPIAPGAFPLAPVTIVVIDSDPRVATFVAQILEGEGYRVAIWRTGAGAHDFIARVMPAAVVLNGELETRNAGMQVFAQIAADEFLRAIPVVLTSARTQHTGESPEMAGGLRERTLVKPYTAEALIAAIERAIASGQRGEAVGS